MILCVKCVRESMEATDGWWPRTSDRHVQRVIIHKGESICEEHFMEVVENE